MKISDQNMCLLRRNYGTITTVGISDFILLNNVLFGGDS